jgi:hypothetical protein
MVIFTAIRCHFGSFFMRVKSDIEWPAPSLPAGFFLPESGRMEIVV